MQKKLEAFNLKDWLKMCDNFVRKWTKQKFRKNLKK